MKLRITNDRQLLGLYQEYGIKPAANITQLLIAIFNDAEKHNIRSCRIYVHIDFLAPSYAINPSMFARTITNKINYLVVQGKLIKKATQVFLRAANSKVPTTFRAMAIRALTKKKKFVAFKADIPRSYRIRPSLFIRSIESEVDGDIAMIAKGDRYIWKLKVDNV